MHLNAALLLRSLTGQPGVLALVSLCLLSGPVLAQNGGRTPTSVSLSPEAVAEAEARKIMRSKQLRKEGRQLYKNGRYAEAIERYEAAYDVIPDNELIYSIAISYQQLRLWRRCIESFERYLKASPLNHKRDRAINAKESCEARVEVRQMLNIQTTPPGANVFVGRRSEPMVGQTPLSITLPAGPHQVWIELDGYEAEAKKIEMRREESFELALNLRPLPQNGRLFVDSNIIDAQVYLDGERLRFTPFKQPVTVAPGAYQLVVERDGYARFKEQVAVQSDGLTRVPVSLQRTEGQSTWRTPGGWAAIAAGLGSIGLGIMAQQTADGLFNDTDRFNTMANQEVLGHVVGGLLVALGSGLLTWDAVVRTIPPTHRNPDFGRTPLVHNPPDAGRVQLSARVP